jgi:hypothetical protein
MSVDNPSSSVNTLFHRIVGSSLVVVVLALLAVIGIGGFFGFQMHQREAKRDQTLEAVVSNLKILNEQAIIRQILEEKAGDKLTPDQLSRCAFEFNEGCRRGKIPPHIVFGIMETESGFDPDAKNLKAATPSFGWFQMTVDTAIPLFRNAGEVCTVEKLMDPVRNLVMGIQTIIDKHDAVMLSGKAPADDWTRALWLYNGKGETYSRKILEASVKYQKILEAPLKK